MGNFDKDFVYKRSDKYARADIVFPYNNYTIETINHAGPWCKIRVTLQNDGITQLIIEYYRNLVNPNGGARSENIIKKINEAYPCDDALAVDIKRTILSIEV